MYLLFLMKYKSYIIGLFIGLLVIFGLWKYNKYHYNKGYEAGVYSQEVKVKAIEQKYQEQLLAYAELQDTISTEYEATKQANNKQKEIEYVEVQKMVEKPIYLNNCIDGYGLSKLNEIISPTSINKTTK